MGTSRTMIFKLRWLGGEGIETTEDVREEATINEWDGTGLGSFLSSVQQCTTTLAPREMLACTFFAPVKSSRELSWMDVVVSSNRFLDSFASHSKFRDLLSCLSRLASLPVPCVDFVMFSYVVV